MQQGNKKITFSGSLARRIFVVCLALLIIPLFIHTFFLYNQEIKTAEADIRANLKAIGTEMAARISDQIHLDWQVLEAKHCEMTLGSIFHIEKSGGGGQLGEQFVQAEENSLRVGRTISEMETRVIVHPIKELLRIKAPPFPIDVAFNVLKTQDQWVEKFPISDTQITLLLGTSDARVFAAEKRHLFFRVATFIVLVVLIGGGAVVILLRKLGRPLKALSLTMQRVAEGAVHSRYAPQRWGFEINAIGLTFNEALDEMISRQQEAESERIKREKLAQELRVGQEIQAGLLPKKFPAIVDLEIDSGFLPAKEVGGDFYDVFSLSSGKTLIVIADLAGKGISACLFSLGLRSSLRALAETSDSISTVVKKANELFLADTDETGEFATLWIGTMEKKTLQFVSLGHPPALLKRGKTIRELSTQYPAMGVMAYEEIQASSIELEDGDELLFYSDGATEAHDREGNLYGLDRLKEAFLSCKKKAGASEILKNIQLYAEGVLQHDDLTLLYILLFDQRVNDLACKKNGN